MSWDNAKVLLLINGTNVWAPSIMTMKAASRLDPVFKPTGWSRLDRLQSDAVRFLPVFPYRVVALSRQIIDERKVTFIHVSVLKNVREVIESTYQPLFSTFTSRMIFLVQVRSSISGHKDDGNVDISLSHGCEYPKDCQERSPLSHFPVQWSHLVSSEELPVGEAFPFKPSFSCQSHPRLFQVFSISLNVFSQGTLRNHLTWTFILVSSPFHPSFSFSGPSPYGSKAHVITNNY